ncbi:M28 family peptidase [Treponema medium]|uniref:M28 family peptidase n=1 Tax=Treponema medium TaxID=58231 RepID=UPI002090B071|nr:M28 family peptidase [Treponema medium]
MTLEQAQAIIASPFFSAFLEPAADRRAFITERLAAQGIPYRTVTLQDKTHIVITYRQSAYNPRFKMKTLIAHYDRAAGTQGANDNSAACVQLLLFAQMLLHKRDAHNIRIIFTDGEEAGADGIKNQGAYRLGQGLRALSMQQDDIFVFDMCGSGDTLILSESGIYGREKQKTAALSALHRRCRIYADAACRGRWLSLPTAYSDNAGLISAGLTAQVITVLPRAEAELLMRYMPPSVFQPKVKENGMHSDRSSIKTAISDGSDVGSQNKGKSSANESAAPKRFSGVLSPMHMFRLIRRLPPSFRRHGSGCTLRRTASKH